MPPTGTWKHRNSLPKRRAKRRRQVMRGKFVIGAAAGMVALAIAILLLWPTDVAKIRCADGWSLVIRTATVGTNHYAATNPRWHPSLRDRSPLRQSWEMFRDKFRAPSKRLLTVRSMEWRSQVPAIALWGGWDGRGPQSHRLRFVLVDDSGVPIASFTTRLALTERPGEGLLATCINLPAALHWRVRVFDDSQPEEASAPLGEFVIRNTMQ